MVTAWNLSRPDQNMFANFAEIKQRGYNTQEVALTGEFANKLADKIVKPLSVSDIADMRCTARRDLYFAKGKKRLAGTQLRRLRTDTWGQKAGHLVQKYTEGVNSHEIGNRPNYNSARTQTDTYHNSFVTNNLSNIQDLKTLEASTTTVKVGDTDWLLKLLRYNFSIEIGAKILDSKIKVSGLPGLQFGVSLTPNTQQIGLSPQATPDFIAPDLRLVGDIKTGLSFEPHFQLTCAGYALAYENEYGEGHEINWGAIYFIPTRIPSPLARPLTSAQLYLFPIDDNLRVWFLSERNAAYKNLAQDTASAVTGTDKTANCPHCRYKNYCEAEEN